MSVKLCKGDSIVMLPELRVDQADEEARWWARKRLLPFARYVTNNNFPLYEHIRVLMLALEAVERGECNRLMVMMPPRHFKSYSTSIMFPAWFLGRHPKLNVGIASYGADLAEGFSQDIRDIVGGPRYPFDITLSKNVRGADTWETSQGGSLYAAGIGGVWSGRGISLGIIDDPFKDHTEAESPVRRMTVQRWYNSTFWQRLQKPLAALILMQTRWHGGDLAGYLLDLSGRGGDKWDVIEFPALCEYPESDVLGRNVGDSLCPAIRTSDEWERLRAILIKDDPQAWYAVCQQQPIPDGGIIFETRWFRRYGSLRGKQFVRVIQAWDTASKDKVANDYSACVTLALGTDGFIYVLDVHLERYTVAQLIGASGAPGVIEQMWRMFASIGLPPSEVVIEDADSGVAALQLLALQTSLPLVAAMAKRSSKEDRARVAASFYKGLRVLHPEPTMPGAGWVAGFERRLARFPNGSDHDDDIDALGHGLLHIGMLPKAMTVVADMEASRVRLDGRARPASPFASALLSGDAGSLGIAEGETVILPAGRM